MRLIVGLLVQQLRYGFSPNELNVRRRQERRRREKNPNPTYYYSHALGISKPTFRNLSGLSYRTRDLRLSSPALEYIQSLLGKLRLTTDFEWCIVVETNPQYLCARICCGRLKLVSLVLLNNIHRCWLSGGPI